MEIPIFKHQITNNIQFINFLIFEIGDWELFEIWMLGFGILNLDVFSD